MDRTGVLDFEGMSAEKVMGPAGAGMLLLEGCVSVLLSGSLVPPLIISLCWGARLPGQNHRYKIHVAKGGDGGRTWSYCDHYDRSKEVCESYSGPHLVRTGGGGLRGRSYRKGREGLIGWSPEASMKNMVMLEDVPKDRQELWLKDYAVPTLDLLLAMEAEVLDYGDAMMLTLTPSQAIKYAPLKYLVLPPRNGTWGTGNGYIRSLAVAGVAVRCREWEDVVLGALSDRRSGKSRLYDLKTIASRSAIVAAGPCEARLIDKYFSAYTIWPASVSILVKAAVTYAQGPYARSLAGRLGSEGLLCDSEGCLSYNVLAGLASATDYNAVLKGDRAELKGGFTEFLIACGSAPVRRGLEKYLERYEIAVQILPRCDWRQGEDAVGGYLSTYLISALLAVAGGLRLRLAPTKIDVSTARGIVVLFGMDPRIEVDPTLLRKISEVGVSKGVTEIMAWARYYSDRQ